MVDTPAWRWLKRSRVLRLDRTDGDLVDVARECDADNRDHLVGDLDGNGDVHRIVVRDAGDHGTVELGAIDAYNDLVTADLPGNDVQSLAFGAVEELALVRAALLADDRGHGLAEDADAAGAGELDARLLVVEWLARQVAGELGTLVLAGDDFARTFPASGNGTENTSSRSRDAAWTSDRPKLPLTDNMAASPPTSEKKREYMILSPAKKPVR